MELIIKQGRTLYKYLRMHWVYAKVVEDAMGTFSRALGNVFWGSEWILEISKLTQEKWDGVG